MKAKHTLAGALALAMLASTAVSFQVSAADTAVTLKGAKVEAEAGGEFSVDVSLEDIPSTKVNVMDFAVTYDQTVLNVDSVKIGKSAAVDVSGDSTASDAPVFATNIKDGEITVSWTTALDSNSWISEDGVILTITGTVKDGVADGTVTPIDFAPVTRETYDGSGKNNSSMVIGYVYGGDSATYTINAEAGSVTIGSKQTTTVTTTEGGKDTTATEATTTATESKTDVTKATTTISGNIVTGTVAPGSVLYGDVNCDGTIDILDAVLLQKYLNGSVQLNYTQLANSDCQKDSQLDITDVTVLMQYLLRSFTSLPVA